MGRPSYVAARPAVPAVPAVPPPVDPITAMIRAAIRAELEPLLTALSKQQAQPDYLDRRACAQRLGISLATLDRLCRDGTIPFVVVGDSRRFRSSDVDVRLSVLAAGRGGDP